MMAMQKEESCKFSFKYATAKWVDVTLKDMLKSVSIFVTYIGTEAR